MLKKKTKKKNIMALFLAVVMLVSITGCEKKMDASAYVKATLDLYTKNDVTDYTKLTGVTKDAAEDIYRDEIDSVLDSLALGTDSDMSEEMSNKYTALCRDILATASYTVGEAKETKKGYTVALTTKKAMITKDVKKKMQEELDDYQKQLYKDLQAGKDLPSDEEIAQKAYQMMYDLLDENLKNITYGDEEKTSVNLEKQEDGIYAISEKEMTDLSGKFYDFSELE